MGEKRVVLPGYPGARCNKKTSGGVRGGGWSKWMVDRNGIDGGDEQVCRWVGRNGKKSGGHG